MTVAVDAPLPTLKIVRVGRITVGAGLVPVAKVIVEVAVITGLLVDCA